MSVKAMGKVWDADLPRDEKNVLLAYADHASHDGANIYPSIGRMAWKTGYTRRSIQTITAKLRNKGILVPDGAGPHGVNRYCLDFAALPQREGYQGGANSAPRKKQQGGVQNLHGGAQKTAERDANSAPNPSIEPSRNHQENHHPDLSGSDLLDQFLGPATPRQPTEPTGSNYAIPVQAGGDHSPAFAIVDGICRYNGLTQGANSLPAKKRTQWIRHIAEMIEAWGGATTAQSRLAWQAWTIDYAWKGQTNPFYKSFETEIGPLLVGVREGSITTETLRAKTLVMTKNGDSNDTNRKHNSGNGRFMIKPPAEPVDPEVRALQRKALRALRTEQAKRAQPVPGA